MDRPHCGSGRLCINARPALVRRSRCCAAITPNGPSPFGDSIADMNQMGKNMQQEGKQVFTASTVDKMKTDLDLGQWTEAEKIILTCRMLAMESHSETLDRKSTRLKSSH